MTHSHTLKYTPTRTRNGGASDSLSGARTHIRWCKHAGLAAPTTGLACCAKTHPQGCAIVFECLLCCTQSGSHEHTNGGYQLHVCHTGRIDQCLCYKSACGARAHCREVITSVCCSVCQRSTTTMRRTRCNNNNHSLCPLFSLARGAFYIIHTNRLFFLFARLCIHSANTQRA